MDYIENWTAMKAGLHDSWPTFKADLLWKLGYFEIWTTLKSGILLKLSYLESWTTLIA